MYSLKMGNDFHMAKDLKAKMISTPARSATLFIKLRFFLSNASSITEHERFGIGDVIKVEGIGENSKATVRFRNAGEKQLLLKFARFKVVE